MFLPFDSDGRQILQNSQIVTSRPHPASQAMPITTGKTGVTKTTLHAADSPLGLSLLSPLPANHLHCASDTSSSSSALTLESAYRSFLLNPPMPMPATLARKALLVPGPSRNRKFGYVNRSVSDASISASEPMAKRVRHESSSTYIPDRIEFPSSDVASENRSEYTIRYASFQSTAPTSRKFKFCFLFINESNAF